MQSVLGGLLKGYRLQKGLTQSDLSARIGWKAHPSRLSRYEQGLIVPSRATLEKLSQALALRSDDRGRLFMEAGYEPTDAEVSAVLRWLQPFMDEWHGPAYLTDFSWRFLACNAPAAMVLGLPKNDLQRLLGKSPTLLDLAFDPRWPARRQIPEEVFPSFGRGQIARFKAQQRDCTGQRWYRKLLRRLMPLPSFAELWNTTPGELGSALMDYIRMQFKTPFRELTFHTFASAVVSDPRLFVILWLPADTPTAQAFSGIGTPGMRSDANNQKTMLGLERRD